MFKTQRKEGILNNNLSCLISRHLKVFTISSTCKTRLPILLKSRYVVTVEVLTMFEIHVSLESFCVYKRRYPWELNSEMGFLGPREAM